MTKKKHISLNEFLYGKNWKERTDIPFETDFKGNITPNPNYIPENEEETPPHTR